MDERSRMRVVLGVLMIVLGLGFLAMRLLQQQWGNELFLFVLGAAFIAGYFYRRAYGLLIAGCILVGVALGSVGEENWGLNDFSLIGLGIGFIAIYVIDLAHRRRAHWWPLVPGLVLIAAGLARIVPNLGALLTTGWPLILVLVGLLLLAGAVGVLRRGET